MPTKNPRITITLNPSVSAHLRRISELSGNSQSALVSEMLDQAAPVLSRMVAVLEAAHLAKADLGAQMTAGLNEAQTKLEAQMGLALDLFDEGARPILEAGEVIKRRAAGAGGPRLRGAIAAAERRSTPMSNRGVRSTPSKSKVVP